MNVSELTWEPTPTYADLLRGMVEYANFVIYEPSQVSGASYWTLFAENGLGIRGISLIFGMAYFLTIARRFLTTNVLQPLGRRCRFTAAAQGKMPECAWRFFFYTFAWSLTFYLCVIKYRFFQRPSTTFKNWEPNADVPWDLNLLYAVEFAFYIHSLYTIFFMDLWKKDSLILIVHHVLTLFLLGFSWIGRYSQGGSLVLLFHDCCDVLLEFAKINSYFKVQGGKLIRVFDYLATLSFGLFACTWFVSRMYFYPLKLIHTLSFNIKFGHLPRMHLMHINYAMAVFLLAMNVYWFVLIVDLTIRVISGRMEELDDPRDYDVQTDTKSSAKDKSTATKEN